MPSVWLCGVLAAPRVRCLSSAPVRGQAYIADILHTQRGRPGSSPLGPEGHISGKVDFREHGFLCANRNVTEQEGWLAGRLAEVGVTPKLIT